VKASLLKLAQPFSAIAQFVKSIEPPLTPAQIKEARGFGQEYRKKQRERYKMLGLTTAGKPFKLKPNTTKP
jgi:hypothetical protein